MKLAALVSGGKDSLYATYLSIKDGNEIKYLITFRSKNTDSYMFHRPCIELTTLQAQTMGIHQIMVDTKGEKEKELEDLKNVLKKIKNEVDGVVTGAVASQYQKSRIDKVCDELGLKSIAPLWQRNPEEVLKEEISVFDVVITSVSSDGLDESWIGRKIDDKSFVELKKIHDRYGLNLVGEGGEYESIVVNAPIFKYKIKIIEANKVWDSKVSSGYLDIKNARLISKATSSNKNKAID